MPSSLSDIHTHTHIETSPVYSARHVWYFPLAGSTLSFKDIEFVARVIFLMFSTAGVVADVTINKRDDDKCSLDDTFLFELG